MEKFIQIPEDLCHDSDIRRVMNFACAQKADRYSRKNVAEHHVRYYEALLETSRRDLLEAERGIEEIERAVETLIDNIRQWIVPEANTRNLPAKGNVPTLPGPHGVDVPIYISDDGSSSTFSSDSVYSG
jgi:hypothetical protein